MISRLSDKHKIFSAIGLGVLIALMGVVIFYYYRAELGSVLWKTFRLAQPAILLNEDAQLALDIGNYYLNAGNTGVYDLEKAQKYFNKSLEIDPSISGPWLKLGTIDFLGGYFWSAIAKFNKQLEFHGDMNARFFMRTHYMRGLTFGYIGFLGDAKADFLNLLVWNKGLENETSWAYYNDLAWIYFQMGDYQRTEEVAEEALLSYPDNPWLLNMRGVALLNLERKDVARTILSRAIEEGRKLTEEDWKRAYPGNDPRLAGQGLSAMIEALEFNLSLAVDK